MLLTYHQNTLKSLASNTILTLCFSEKSSSECKIFVQMVKFSKQFQGQLVPEWKDAFVDYGLLKKDLKKIHLPNVENAPSNHRESSLRKTIVSSIRRISFFGNKRRDHGIIHVLYLYLYLKLCTTSSYMPTT